MSTFESTNPFSVCFTSMKIRYSDYESSIKDLNFLTNKDKVNVFISFESVLSNISMLRDLRDKLLTERQFTYMIEAEAINLCAHYKRFFRDNDLETRVFLYYTDLCSDNYINFKYNDEFRSYYREKYLCNGNLGNIGIKLVDTIIPRLEKIMQFIPGVYFISGKNIEGSLIPWIIGNQDTNYKNFIISNDKYDTQYLSINDNYCLHYIKRSPMGIRTYCTFDKYLTDLLKNNKFEADINMIRNNSSFYTLIMSACGDVSRSLDPLKGIGEKTIINYLINGINDGLLTKDTSSIDMLETIIPDDQRERASNNFNCINLENQYRELGDQDIFNITNQIVDRFDYNSLLRLNREDYANYQLMLNELTH